MLGVFARGDGAILIADVVRELDHAGLRAVRPKSGVIAAPDPHLLALRVQPAIGAGVKLPGLEPVPKLGIFTRGGIIRLAEHAMVATFDIGKAIAEQVEEIIVGAGDPAFAIEGDDRRRSLDRPPNRRRLDFNSLHGNSP